MFGNYNKPKPLGGAFSSKVAVFNKLESWKSPSPHTKQLGIHIEAIVNAGAGYLNSPRTNRLHFSLRNKPTVLQACHALVMHGLPVCSILDETLRVAGQLSMTDIVRNVLASGLNPARVLCSNVMRKDIITVVEGAERGTLEIRAAEVMIRCGIDHLVVTDSYERFIRTLLVSDLVKDPHKATENDAALDNRQIRPFKVVAQMFQAKLKSILKRTSNTPDLNDPVFVNSEVCLEDCAREMKNRDCNIVFSQHPSKPNWIVAVDEASILRAVTLGFDLKRTLVREALGLLHLPEVEPCILETAPTARRAILAMRRIRLPFLLMKLKESSEAGPEFKLITLVDVCRTELRSLAARKMLRGEFLRHVSFRRGTSLRKSHLLRLPSGKKAALPLDPSFIIPIPSARSKMQLEESEQCIERGDFKEAITILSHYLQRNPMDSRAYVKRGLILQNQNRNLDDATADFKQALETGHLPEEERRDLLIMLCTAYLDLGYFDKASAVWTLYSLDEDSNLTSSVLNFAMKASNRLTDEAHIAMEDRRDYEGALKFLDKAVKLNDFTKKKTLSHDIQRSLTVRVLLLRATCRQRLSRIDDALLDCRLALETDPSSRDALYMMLAMEHACELEPKINAITLELGRGTTAELYLRRASLEFEQGAYVQALRDFRSAVRLKPDCLSENDLEALCEVLRVGEELNDIITVWVEMKMFHYIRNVLLFEGPADSVVFHNITAATYDFLAELVLTHRKAGMNAFGCMQFRVAVDELTSALSICEHFANVKESLKDECGHMYVTRATCYASVKDFGRAIMDCDTAIELYPLNEKAWIVRGQCLQGAGRNDELLRTTMEARLIFGPVSCPEIAELIAHASAVLPGEAAECAPITSESVFDSIPA